ncbi:MAG: hypothetical protein RBU30_11960 [Polyangia bacterium]|jgi:hypothetical protein|nr:hypothetical protein [Polyangia bacterium]
MSPPRLRVLLVAQIALSALSLCVACGGEKKKSAGNAEERIETQGGISVIPRGTVKLASAKGEHFFLEVEAPVSVEQALSFYRSQLPRDRWEDVSIAQLSPELWGLQATRGMFELTGRIKRLDAQRVSIGFERKVRTTSAAWIPPVGKEVVTLTDSIRWDDRVFEAGGSRVELRGRSNIGQSELRKSIESALRAAGWTVEDVPAGGLKARWKDVKPPRELHYKIEALPKGSQVALTLGLGELVEARRPAAARPKAERPEPMEAENLVPVPPDLLLWKEDAPPAANKTDDILNITFERPCKTPDELLKEVQKRLTERGFKLMPKTDTPGESSELAPSSVTASKGKRLVVAIVNKEVAICTVSLMVTDK